MGSWAQRNLKPEGPLAAIRIDDQPYGLLPVTALEDWRAAQGDPPVEQVLRGPLLRLRERLATAAERRGTVHGADTRRFLGLLGDTPVSGAYSVRWFLPLDLLAILESAYGSAVDPQLLNAWWERTASVPLTLAPNPARRYATLGRAEGLAIPLVEPLRFPRRGSVPLGVLIQTLAEAALDMPELLVFPARIFHEFHELADGISGDALDAPDSLLIRLLIHSFVVAAARANQPSNALLDPPVMDTDDETALAQALASGNPWTASGEAGAVLGTTLNATRTLAEHARGHGTEPIERAFRAVLDTASHRVDPWITGIAWRRYIALRRQGALSALGAYGWLDGPLIGRDGPTEGGLLHAPSDLQARTAVVLRDKAISAPDEKWKLTLRSDTVRAARQLSEEVRMGAHPAEAVGRMVERAVAKRARIAIVRERFAAAGDEHGRRACDGLAVLAPQADLSFLTAAERKAVEGLREVLDAYADLLVADAVHKVVGGRMDLARPAMEAAAGMATPPELDVLRTPRRGRAATTSVRVVLPGPPARPAPARQDRRRRRRGLHRQRGRRGGELDVAAPRRLESPGAPRRAGARARRHARALGGRARPPRCRSSRRGGERDEAAAGPGKGGGPRGARCRLAGDGPGRRSRAAAATCQARHGGRDAERHVGAGTASRQLLTRAARWGIAPAPLEDEPLVSVLERAAAELDARLETCPGRCGADGGRAHDRALGARLRRPPAGARARPVGVAARSLAGRREARCGTLARDGRGGSTPPPRARLAPARARRIRRPQQPRRPVADETTPGGAEGERDSPRARVRSPERVRDPRVAVSLVDRFVEVVPTAQHATTAAFGFNAPAARAPRRSSSPFRRSWIGRSTRARSSGSSRRRAGSRARGWPGPRISTSWRRHCRRRSIRSRDVAG